MLQAQRPATRRARRSRRRATGTSRRRPRPRQRRGGIPSWVWLAGFAVLGFVLWRGFSRSRPRRRGGRRRHAGGGYAAPGDRLRRRRPGPARSARRALRPRLSGAGYAPQRSGMLGVGLGPPAASPPACSPSEMLHSRRDGDTPDRAPSAQPGFFDSPQAARTTTSRTGRSTSAAAADWDAGVERRRWRRRRRRRLGLS